MKENKIRKENIIVDMVATDKYDVINQVAQVLHQNNCILDKDIFIKDVTSRENEISTGIGQGIAIPHGKSDSVIASTVAVVKLKNPIDWESHDDQPVSLVFLLAIKNQAESKEHLRMLADVSTKLMDDEFIENIGKAKTVDDLFQVLGEI